jgi:DNA polymerase I-like protein with 3'-5' exonuclease and polymerase domains
VDHGAWLLGIDLDKFKQTKKPIQEFTFTVIENILTDGQIAYDFLSNCVLIAYDIETKTYGGTSKKDIEKGDWSQTMPEAGDTLITCCSWTGLHKNGKIETFVLPMIDFDVTHWLDDISYGLAIELLREINDLPVPKVMQNGMYDCTHSLIYHAPPRNYILDTMVLMHSQYSTLPKSLDFLASIFLYDYIQWKNEAAESSKAKDINRYWAYNARDTFSTLRICMEQLRTLPPYALKNYAKQFPLSYPALYCNFEGEKIDLEKRNQLRAAQLLRLEANLNSLRVLVHDPAFNPGSWQQVAIVVYDIFGATDPKIGWKKDPKTKKKTKMFRGTDEKNLKAVGEQHPILLRVTNAIIAYREAQKAIGTYFDFTLKNGRLLYALNPFGTETGRMACQSSSFWCGTQVQNIPGYAKDMCVADEGFQIMEADNSQSEARCTAYLSKEWNLANALETPGKDFYKSLGTLFFGMDYDSVTKDFRNNVLKKIVHGTNYMMGADTFVDNAGVANVMFGASVLGAKIDMSKKGEVSKFAASLLEAYHKPFPRVRMWYSETKNQIRTNKMLVSPLGHTRYFFGDIDKKYQIFASAVAHGPQNLSVSILNIGFWKIWELVKISGGAIRLKAQIHDSVKTQIRLDRTDFISATLKCLDNPVTINGRILRIPVDYKLGLNWGNGMVEYKTK